MKHSLIVPAGLGLALVLAALQARGTEVGVSIQVSQPGVYGRIDIGQFPKPRVVAAQPVLIERPPAPPRESKGSPLHQKAQEVAQERAQQRPQERAREPLQPVYMWVPPGHRKNWRKHCREYGACGVPVYFVDQRWYDEHVHPRGKHRGKERERDDDDDRGRRGKGKDD